MALSEIIINDIVQSQTNTVIGESNYHILRQSLLERKPLLRVLNPVQSLLSELYTKEKQELINQLTQLACESQKNHDDQESISDEQERNNDSSLKDNYEKERDNLEKSLTQLEIKCFQQQNHFDQVNTQWNELTIKLSQINNTIDRIHSERQLLNRQYPTYNVHQHPIIKQSTHIYPELYLLKEQLAVDELLQEENKLLEERQKILYFINSKEAERTKEEQQLIQLFQEKKEATTRYGEIKHQLDLVLPDNEKQRELRKEARSVRENARNYYDPNLLQLAPKNLEALKQHIESQSHQLDKKRDQLLSEATRMSYQVYLNQLELALQQTENSPYITFNENNALKMIVSMMKNWTELEEKEKVIINALNEENNTLRSLQKNLIKNTQQLQNHLSAYPHLVQQNKDLTEKNEQLQLNFKFAASQKTNALYVSVLGMGGCLLSTGILNTLIITPIFFAIPGALAMVSLVALVIALAFHYQKYSSEAQMKQNSKTIETNEVTLVKEWKKAHELSLTNIPSINNDIEKAEKTVVDLEQQLKNQQHSMNLLLNKAQNVSCTYSGNNNFFGNTTPENVVNFPFTPQKKESLYPIIKEEPLNFEMF